VPLWTPYARSSQPDTNGDCPRRGEVVRKFRSRVVNLQVSASAWSFCKSVGVCLRRFESCTCHRCDVSGHRGGPNSRSVGSALCALSVEIPESEAASGSGGVSSRSVGSAVGSGIDDVRGERRTRVGRNLVGAVGPGRAPARTA
jgi:hypothetical protein